MSSFLARTIRDSFLASLPTSIVVGHLVVVDNANGLPGDVLHFGQQDAPGVTLTINNNHFWLRLLLSGTISLGEAYMAGEVDIKDGDLEKIMLLWLDNRPTMSSTLTSIATRVLSTLSSLHISFFGQSKTNARLNAVMAYDQSNALFQAFLSQEMMYSCALWSTDTPRIAEQLDQAQHRKIHHALTKARVKAGDRVLEIGSGWGGLAIEAAKSYGCKVDTLTLSKEQKALADERIKALGLQDQITVHLMDYRDALLRPEWESAFDAVVSIEMVEHVGTSHYKTFFSVIDYALKPRNATAVISGSTFPEGRYSKFQSEDFMRRYMWPNSALPSPAALVDACGSVYAKGLFSLVVAFLFWLLGFSFYRTAAEGKEPKARMTLSAVEDHSGHYARTLREWDRRLKKACHEPSLETADSTEWASSTATTPGMSRSTTSSTLSSVLPSPVQEVLDIDVLLADNHFRSEEEEEMQAVFGGRGKLEQHLMCPIPAQEQNPIHLREELGLEDPAMWTAFKRKWAYFFAYASAGFERGYIGCHMLVWIREGDVA